jgi:hypothetical protein
MKLSYALAAATLCVLAVGPVVADDKEEEKSEIREMAQKNLQRAWCAAAY